MSQIKTQVVLLVTKPKQEWTTSHWHWRSFTYIVQYGGTPKGAKLSI